MHRRSFLSGTLALLGLPAAAQGSRRAKVALLSIGSEAVVANFTKRVEAGLAGAGLRADVRVFLAEGEDALAMGKAATLAVAWEPDALFTPAPPLTFAAQGATRKIPIVFFAVPDPDTLGLVRSIARPGGNLTGSGVAAASLVLKRMEVAREVLPRAKRLHALYRKRPNTPWMLLDRIRSEMAAAAPGLGLEFGEIDVGSAGLAATLAALEKVRPDIVVPFGPYDWEPHGGPVDTVAVLRDYERRTGSLVVTETPYAVQNGMTLAMYDGGSQLAAGIDQLVRVLRGASPAELPVLLPLAYELAVNRGAARALGITLPASVLVRAKLVVD